MDSDRQMSSAGLRQAHDSRADNPAEGHTRESVELRLLLGLHRWLKTTAERELATTAQRLRSLRNDINRGQAELRLFADALRTRSHDLARTLSRVQQSYTAAEKACARLRSLEQEHEELTSQLATARRGVQRLRASVGATPPSQLSAFGALNAATQSLASDLAQASADHSKLRARGQDLAREGDALGEQVRALQACFSSLGRAVAALCDHVDAALEARTAHSGQPTSPADHRAEPS